jgi:hypothetical protein
VNNASLFAFASLEETTDEQLHKMLDTNLWGTIITCREALKHFGKDGGSIINIGSMSSERFSAGAVAYTASKAGITGVTGVLAVELASRGIRVNQINPGAVDTEGARAIGAMSDEARAAHIARTPLGRVGTPADIASVAVFLASDEARRVTRRSDLSARARRPLCGHTGHRLLQRRACSCEGLWVRKLGTPRPVRRLGRVFHNQFDDSPDAFARPKPCHRNPEVDARSDATSGEPIAVDADACAAGLGAKLSERFPCTPVHRRTVASQQAGGPEQQ